MRAPAAFDAGRLEHVSLEQLLGRLEGVKRTCEGHGARCPAHEDRRASLSVSEGDDGRVLLHCHAGCELDAICAALDLEPRQLFAPRAMVPLPSRRRAAAPPPLSDVQVERMAAALRADADAWRHVTEVLRLSPDVARGLRLGLYVKDGRRWLAYPYRVAGVWSFANCRSLDGDKDFTRTPAKQPTRLYRVDELRDGGAAVLFEGERDAAAALSLGLGAELEDAGGGVAIVAMPGADMTAVAVADLAGQQLIYLATDDDPPGDAAAEKIADKLGRAKCRRVRFPKFKKEDKDLGDLLSAKGPDDGLDLALDAFAAAAPLQVDGQQPAPAPVVAATATGYTAGGFEFIRASAVKAEHLGWLMPGFIPRAMLSDLSADPGTGKSSIMMSLAAATTRGLVLPRGEGEAKPAPVVLFTTEDGLGCTVRQRLLAEGADLDKVVLFNTGASQRYPTFPADLAAVEALVLELGARLVSFDPALVFMDPGLDSHKQQDVARFTAGLAGLAQRTGAAVVTVRHLSKARDTSAIYKGAGSIGFVAQARMALLAAKDRERGARVLSVVKGNVGKDVHAVTFDIVERAGGTVVAWGEPTTVSADELVNQDVRKSQRESVKLEAAKDLIASLLSKGSVLASEVQAAAKAAGIGRTVLYQAKAALRVGGDRGLWALP